MLGLGQLREKGGKDRPLVIGIRPNVKYNPSLSYEIVFCLGKQGFWVGSLRRDKGCKARDAV
ncbi:hypothetical protein C7B69_23055 [filamentous cyanobacterium Phorm 46]|nr:hypothetical protein C7B69_23055 [filamentous cyanobacterium Phorm 46]